jgi:tetratricopeptide (TPR) repeat protein
MKIIFLSVILFFIQVICFGQTHVGVRNQTPCYTYNYPEVFKEYSGRYKLDDFNFLEVHYNQGNLLLIPRFWNSMQILKKVQQDSFLSEGHEILRYKFIRNPDGLIYSVRLFGFQQENGQYKKILGKSEPLELILNGEVDKGAQQLLAKHSKDTSALVGIGEKLNIGFCSKHRITEQYLQMLSKYFANYAPLYAALGNTYLLLGQRTNAIASFERSVKLDPHNEEGLISLQLLHVNTYPKTKIDSASKLSYDLKEVFKKPQPGEIERVERQWKERDLSAKEVIIEDSGQLDLTGIHTRVYIIHHLVHGFKHYGAVVIPDNHLESKKPAIIELKGVNPRYSPMDLNNGLSSYRFLCMDAAKFIYIVPSYRGEKLIFNSKEYLSEGDRADAYDGATDDAISLLNAAIKSFPQIDQDKIAVFGKSRGATVALLAGIRDKRIKCVLDWAGPVDWFNLMNELGYTQEEFVDAGLINRSTPFQVGGQFIEWYLLKNIQGKDGLAEARNRIIASSPLYFLSRLPLVQAHYGVEDGIVPMRNGMAIQSELNKRAKKKNQGVFFHQNVGHDLDQMIAFGESRKFLMQMLQ